MERGGKPEPRMVVGYKCFTNTTSKIFTCQRLRSRKRPRGKWLNSQKQWNDVPAYMLGWHIFRTLAAAHSYVGYATSYVGYNIIKVYGYGVVAVGSQSYINDQPAWVTTHLYVPLGKEKPPRPYAHKAKKRR
jgi:hypothetical protein